MSEYGKQSNYIEKSKIIKADSRKWLNIKQISGKMFWEKKKKYK